MPQLGALQKDLRRELEAGTFFLHAQSVYEKILQTLQYRRHASEWNAELEELVLELLAGLAAFNLPAYSQKLDELVRDPVFAYPAKVKALQVIRHHLINPDYSVSCLSLYEGFLHAPDAGLRDFAARSILQLMTEMRVGGQIDLILTGDSTRNKLKGLLEELSNQDWLEAAELLDFLEMTS